MSEPIPAIRFVEYAGFDPKILDAARAGTRMRAAFSHVIGSEESSMRSGVDLDGDGMAEFSIVSLGIEGVHYTQEGGDGTDFNYCRQPLFLGPQYPKPAGYEGSDWYPCSRGSASSVPARMMTRLSEVTTWLEPQGASRICIGDECAPSDQPGKIKLRASYGWLPDPLAFTSFVYVGDFNLDGLADFAVACGPPYGLGGSCSVYLQVKAATPTAIEDSPY